MAAHGVSGVVPADFARAVAALRAVRLRPEVTLSEVPSPGRIAPYSMALSAEVGTRGLSAEVGTNGLSAEVGAADEELASGRFVLLHDPAGQDAWEGTMRAVTFVRAELEPEMGGDPVLGDVGWTWLLECLAAAGAHPVAAGGTVTRVISQSHGSLADRPPVVEIEIRASWTPVDADLGPHLRGWAGLLCAAAGLPPVPDGVRLLHRGT